MLGEQQRNYCEPELLKILHRGGIGPALKEFFDLERQ